MSVLAEGCVAIEHTSWDWELIAFCMMDSSLSFLIVPFALLDSASSVSLNLTASPPQLDETSFDQLGHNLFILGMVFEGQRSVGLSQNRLHFYQFM